MNILAEIHRNEGVNTGGRTVYRTAIRGVTLRGAELLMVHSTSVGDYKFPGGGLQPGESHAEALSREIEEECGMRLVSWGREIGVVLEYDFAEEREYDTFQMASYYYECQVEQGSGVQRLDDYEEELGFQPVWIHLEQALLLNKDLRGSSKAPEWLRREIFMLEHIRENILYLPET